MPEQVPGAIKWLQGESGDPDIIKSLPRKSNHCNQIAAITRIAIKERGKALNFLSICQASIDHKGPGCIFTESMMRYPNSLPLGLLLLGQCEMREGRIDGSNVLSSSGAGKANF